MSVKKEYCCNLCRKRLKDDDDGIGLGADGVGFKWQPNDDIHQTGHLWQSENHLCLECIEAVHGLWIRLQVAPVQD